jgi:type II secretory pathway predicted ATPase ExeA
LHYGLVERRGVLVLIAAPGMGKTTLLYRLLEQWKERADTIFVCRPPESREQLLAFLLEDLGLTPEPAYVQNWRRLQTHALECRRRGRRLILVIDEAQALSDTELEEVRLLSNLEAPEEKFVDIILAGQSGLAELLARPEQTQLRQRIGVSAQIPALDLAEVRRYVEHRLRVAGQARARILSGPAMAALAEMSGGVPGNINTICFEALSQVFAEGHRKVGEPALRRAAAILSPGLHAGGLSGARPRPKFGWIAAAVGAGVAAGALAANLYHVSRSLEWRSPARFFSAVTAVEAAPPATLSPAPGPALAESSLAQPPSSGQVRVSPAEEIPTP